MTSGRLRRRCGASTRPWRDRSVLVRRAFALGLAFAAAAVGQNAFPVVLAAYTTEYPEAPASNVGRSWNIALAARRLDGLVIAPGETLSFNDRVEGIGGGVCQVA